jgi:hypothetical protein
MEIASDDFQALQAEYWKCGKGSGYEHAITFLVVTQCPRHEKWSIPRA